MIIMARNKQDGLGFPKLFSLLREVTLKHISDFH